MCMILLHINRLAHIMLYFQQRTITMIIMLNREHQFANEYRSGICLSVSVCLLLCCTAAVAADSASEDTATTTAYIDSVNSWGTWELGIEPAAGPQPPNSHVMAVRSANIQFRPNDNATFRPKGEEVTINMPAPNQPPAPIPPPVPIQPPVPTTPVIDPVPLAPGVPPPMGGPADGLF